MPFCTQCGKELRPGARFCHSCGAPVTVGDTPPAGPTPPVNPTPPINPTPPFNPAPPVNPTPPFNPAPPAGGGSKTPYVVVAVIAVIVALAAILALILPRITGGGTPAGPDIGAGIPPTASAGPADSTVYADYVNSSVRFSLRYPADYTVTEPYENTVVISDEDPLDFQAAAEYAFQTVAGGSIYSGEDLAVQMQQDPSVLSDWLGSEVSSGALRRETVDGRDCWMCDFDVTIQGIPHTGRFHIFDGDGDFGCYTFFWLFNEESDRADLYRLQGEAMEESFRVTGAYQADDRSLYTTDALDLTFILRDSVMTGEVYESGDSICVYPVDGVFSESNIWLRLSPYDEDRDPDYVLEGIADYFFQRMEDTRYASERITVDSGAYPCTGITLSYSDGGRHFYNTIFTFLYEGRYWRLTSISTDEYYEVTSSACLDLITSLRIGSDVTGGGSGQPAPTPSASPADRTEDMAVQVLRDVLARDDVLTGSSDAPLAVLADFNGDSTMELMLHYTTDQFVARYELWRLDKTQGPVCLDASDLYMEAGGNEGDIGIVESGGQVYLALHLSAPTGSSTSETYFYWVWPSYSPAPDFDEPIYMAAGSQFDDPSDAVYSYSYMGEPVSKARFDEVRAPFQNWTVEMNIFAGSGGAVLTAEELLSALE